MNPYILPPLLHLFIICMISACSAKTYEPQEYSIRDKEIRDFEVSGRVTVKSINMQESPEIIYKNFSTFKSSFQNISSSMAKQLEKEIKENSSIDGNLDKQLFIQLNNFYVQPIDRLIEFNVDFTLIGERGFEKHFKYNGHSENTSTFTIEDSFNQAIAQSVRKVLRNGETLRYLANTNLKKTL